MHLSKNKIFKATSIVEINFCEQLRCNFNTAQGEGLYGTKGHAHSLLTSICSHCMSMLAQRQSHSIATYRSVYPLHKAYHDKQPNIINERIKISLSDPHWLHAHTVLLFYLSVLSITIMFPHYISSLYALQLSRCMPMLAQARPTLF